MKTKKEVIEFVKSELSSNNALILATSGNGGSGLALIQNQEDDFINNLISVSIHAPIKDATACL